MSETFNPDEMLIRFRERAESVKRRGVPPIEGEARKAFIDQAQLDYMDYSILADSTATLSDGVLTIRIDLNEPR